MRNVLIGWALNFVFFTQILGQDQMLEDIGIALSTNIAKEVVSNMHTTLKLQLAERSVILTDKAAAEKALRIFFNDHEAASFEYMTPAKVINSLLYRIGVYKAQTGEQYRVYLLFKEKEEKYYLSTLSFTAD
ncbi:DUF4783 domain-containing protein [Cyclobacteriaceae bacterium]|jgi:hypothetical protein|nr:DUF4783 domain-containing protein [Cyclobacteriaceae bacterium]|tara:strand:+ start:817 stop:1212 length:396 start_codon:yes stop_codon:yes gene_type:complete